MDHGERRGARDNDRMAELPVVDTGGARSPSLRTLLQARAGGSSQANGNGQVGSRGPGDPVELLGLDRKRGGPGESLSILFGCCVSVSAGFC